MQQQQPAHPPGAWRSNSNNNDHSGVTNSNRNDSSNNGNNSNSNTSSTDSNSSNGSNNNNRNSSANNSSSDNATLPPGTPFSSMKEYVTLTNLYPQHTFCPADFQFPTSVFSSRSRVPYVGTLLRTSDKGWVLVVDSGLIVEVSNVHRDGPVLVDGNVVVAYCSTGASTFLRHIDIISDPKKVRAWLAWRRRDLSGPALFLIGSIKRGKSPGDNAWTARQTPYLSPLRQTAHGIRPFPSNLARSFKDLHLTLETSKSMPLDSLVCVALRVGENGKPVPVSQHNIAATNPGMGVTRSTGCRILSRDDNMSGRWPLPGLEPARQVTLPTMFYSPENEGLTLCGEDIANLTRTIGDFDFLITDGERPPSLDQAVGHLDLQDFYDENFSSKDLLRSRGKFAEFVTMSVCNQGKQNAKVLVLTRALTEEIINAVAGGEEGVFPAAVDRIVVLRESLPYTNHRNVLQINKSASLAQHKHPLISHILVPNGSVSLWNSASKPVWSFLSPLFVCVTNHAGGPIEILPMDSATPSPSEENGQDILIRYAGAPASSIVAQLADLGVLSKSDAPAIHLDGDFSNRGINNRVFTARISADEASAAGQPALSLLGKLRETPLVWLMSVDAYRSPHTVTISLGRAAAPSSVYALTASLAAEGFSIGSAYLLAKGKVLLNASTPIPVTTLKEACLALNAAARQGGIRGPAFIEFTSNNVDHHLLQRGTRGQAGNPLYNFCVSGFHSPSCSHDRFLNLLKDCGFPVEAISGAEGRFYKIMGQPGWVIKVSTTSAVHALPKGFVDTTSHMAHVVTHWDKLNVTPGQKISAPGHSKVKLSDYCTIKEVPLPGYYSRHIRSKTTRSEEGCVRERGGERDKERRNSYTQPLEPRKGPPKDTATKSNYTESRKRMENILRAKAASNPFSQLSDSEDPGGDPFAEELEAEQEAARQARAEEQMRMDQEFEMDKLAAKNLSKTIRKLKKDLLSTAWAGFTSPPIDQKLKEELIKVVKRSTLHTVESTPLATIDTMAGTLATLLERAKAAGTPRGAAEAVIYHFIPHADGYFRAACKGSNCSQPFYVQGSREYLRKDQITQSAWKKRFCSTECLVAAKRQKEVEEAQEEKRGEEGNKDQEGMETSGEEEQKENGGQQVATSSINDSFSEYTNVNGATGPTNDNNATYHDVRGAHDKQQGTPRSTQRFLNSFFPTTTPSATSPLFTEGTR